MQSIRFEIKPFVFEMQSTRFEIKPFVFEMRSSLFEIKSFVFEMRSTQFEIKSFVFEMRSTQFEIKSFVFEMRSSLFEIKSFLFEIKSTLLLFKQRQLLLQGTRFEKRRSLSLRKQRLFATEDGGSSGALVRDQPAGPSGSLPAVMVTGMAASSAKTLGPVSIGLR
jgi:hypothetical protein